MRTVVQEEVASEPVLPPSVQAALGELVSVAKDGLLALSVGVGRGVLAEMMDAEVDERAMPSEQDGPGCKLYFRRSDLDTWRRTGGRPRHISSALRRVA